jgi:hypothetical protein
MALKSSLKQGCYFTLFKAAIYDIYKLVSNLFYEQGQEIGPGDRARR